MCRVSIEGSLHRVYTPQKCLRRNRVGRAGAGRTSERGKPEIRADVVVGRGCRYIYMLVLISQLCASPNQRA